MKTLAWLEKNKKWVFSGIGVSVLTLILSFAYNPDNKDDNNTYNQHIVANNAEISGDIIVGNKYENNFYDYDINSNKDIREDNNPELIMSISTYAEHLKEIVGNNIIFFDYNDYDGDGLCEAFAIVKEDDDFVSDNGLFVGKLWYINQHGAKEIEKFKFLYTSSPTFFSAGNKGFIAFNTIYGLNGRCTYIWGVEDKEPYQPNISGKGNGFLINDYNEILLNHSTLDIVWIEKENERLGRSDKYYFFYFNGNTFKEYGGIKIEVEEILKLSKGAEIVNWIYDNSYYIDSIYYRENGIININIFQEDEYEVIYHHIDLRCDGEKINYIRDEINTGLSELNSGFYLKALRPEIATYPDKFPY